MMPVAFLSYARDDLTFDQALGDALSRSGREIAWDQGHTTVRLDLPHVPYTPPCAHPGHYGPLAP